MIKIRIAFTFIFSYTFTMFSVAQCNVCPSQVKYDANNYLTFVFDETVKDFSDTVILNTVSRNEKNAKYILIKVSELEYSIQTETNLQKELAFDLLLDSGVHCPFYNNQSITCNSQTLPRMVCPEVPEACDYSECTDIIDRLSALHATTQNYRWKYNQERDMYRFGSVGIGMESDPNSNYGLSVKGGILTSQYQVQYCDVWGWCDYVFDSNYKLNSLEEEEKYVKIEKRLVGFRSEKELEAEGSYDIVEISVSQQKKIEEAYLHIIALEKRIQNLKEKLDEK